jgi:hypothetical protein
MQENKLIQAFQDDIQAESLLIYAMPYQKLPKISQKAIREVVKEYYIQKIYEITEEE